MILEVIATRVSDAVAAEKGGANRIELVTGIREGGLTPSYGLIEETVHSVSIPVNVMVRPHSISFQYDENDVRTMLADIRKIRSTGAAGIVIGALTQDRKIDVETLQFLLEEAGELDVTFHRAFDEVDDQLAALETLSQFPAIKRILTSGGKPSVLQATEQMSRLVRAARQTHVNILAGAGLTVETVGAFVRQTGVNEVHFGSGVRQKGDAAAPIVPERVTAIRSLFETME